MTKGVVNNLSLYYTDGCHLCDDAMVLLEQLKLSYQKIDIVEKQALVELYGTVIPVIERVDGNTLNWPFSMQQLQLFTSDV